MTRQPLFFVFVVFTILLFFHSYLPNITLSIRARRLAHCPVSDNRVRPQQSGQSFHCNQRCGQEQHRTVCVAEKKQEAQGNDITQWGQFSLPGLKDANETQKNCDQEVGEDQEAAAAEADGTVGGSQ